MAVSLAQAYILTSKASGTTVTYALGAGAFALGRTAVVILGFDNTSATEPTVTGLTVAPGETATWTKIMSHDSVSGAAGTGIRTEVWAITPTINWPSMTLTVTLSAAVTAKHGRILIYNDAGGVDVAKCAIAPAGTSHDALPHSPRARWRSGSASNCGPASRAPRARRVQASTPATCS